MIRQHNLQLTGVSTVPSFYKGLLGQTGARVVGLSTGQYVSFEKDSGATTPAGLTESKIYKVKDVYPSSFGTSGISSIRLEDVTTGNLVTGLGAVSNGTGTLRIVTPVPFVQPPSASRVKAGLNNYSTTVKETGMFPYQYKNEDNQIEGYIDTTLSAGDSSTLKTQIDDVNNYYKNWVNQNVDIEYLNVYEYRVPRSRFSGDRLDGGTENLVYSDAVADKRAGSNVINTDTNEIVTDTSIWDIDLTKVTMYKIEFSWYGAVGALFLAYVPVSNGEARWVRVHHLRASNQLKVSSLGNATLPIHTWCMVEEVRIDLVIQTLRERHLDSLMELHPSTLLSMVPLTTLMVVTVEQLNCLVTGRQPTLMFLV